MSERSTNDIERDINETRAEMSNTISAIQHKLSPAELVDQVIWHLRSGGGRTVAQGAGEFAGNLARTIRENPVPSLLIGTGLAWLAVASTRRRRDYDIYDYDEELFYDRTSRARYGSVEEQMPEHQPHETAPADPVGPAVGDPLHPEPERAAATHPMARRPGMHGSTVGAAAVNHGDPEEEPSASERAQQSAREARERARQVASDRGERAGSAASAAGDRMEQEQTREGLRERAGEWSGKAREGFERAGASVEQGAHETRRRMEGAAASARRGARRAGDRARRGRRRAQSTLNYWIDEYPLAVGAFGLALGAALGALLPATRREDEWFGETRDDLAHRARQEADRTRRVAERSVEAARAEAKRQRLTPEGAKEELRETRDSIRRTAEKKLDETKEETEQAAKAKAEETGDRFRKVGEAAQRTAKEEAERENLGGFRGDRRDS